MPNVYVYDETRVDYFVTDDLGNVPQPVTEFIDYGNVSAQADPPEIDSLQFNINDYGFVSRIGDVYPYGKINITGNISTERAYVPVTTGLGIVSGAAKQRFIKSTWIGSGTLFEIGGGLERLVIPDLGAAGPSPRITGGSRERTTNRYNGTTATFKVVATSAVTKEFNVYPVVSTITISVTGGTSQEYPYEYIQTIVQEQLVGKAREKIAYQYALTEILPFEEDDWGELSDVNGSAFDETTTTFDSTLTQNVAFSDQVIVEKEYWGVITQNPSQTEDYGNIESAFLNKFGKIRTVKYTKAKYCKSFDYSGSGSISVSTGVPPTDTDRARKFAGSGNIVINGQLGLSQAPQHRVFGLGDKIVLSGGSNQRFIPKPIRGSGLVKILGSARHRKTSNPPERKAEILIYGYVDNVKTIFQPQRKTVRINVSGQATRVKLFKAFKGSDTIRVLGALSTLDIRFGPHWRSPLERDGYIEPIDYGFITQSTTEPNEDWGLVSEIPLVINGGGSLDFGYIIPIFTRINIVGIAAQAFARDAYKGLGLINLSGIKAEKSAYIFKSNGLSGIATHPAGFFFSGANWFSQAPQHRVFGIGDYVKVLGTGNESITPTTEIGSGNISISGGLSNLKFVSSAGEQTILTTISGSSKERFIPNFNGSGKLTLSQGREAGQTYLRIITVDPKRSAVLFSVYNSLSIFEKNTESYNNSSISKSGGGSADYGSILNIPSYGFDLSQQGSGNGALTQTFDNETNTYDQDIVTGRRYSDDLISSGLLPTFDKTSSYEVNFGSRNVSEDYGYVYPNTVGGPAYDQYLYPYNTGFSDQDGIDKGYEDLGFLNENPNEQAKAPFGTIRLQQPSFANISRVIPKYPGKVTLFVSGFASQKFVPNWNGSGTLSVLTGAAEAYSAQTPENTPLVVISGSRISERATFAIEGSGNITVSGQIVERATFSEVGSGSINISGDSLNSVRADPIENTVLFTLYGEYEKLKFAVNPPVIKATLRLAGELKHPFIDYTPHYGIDRNVGIETGIFILPGGAGGEYGNPGIVTTRYIPQYPGGYSNGGTAGPIILRDRAISRTNAPIFTEGTIYILGIGTAANGDLNGVQVGAKWRFIPQLVRGGPGLISIKGIAVTAPRRVYGYYGDQKNPGTSGTIVLSTEKRKTEERKIIKITSSAGIISVSGTATERKTNAYQGTGTLFKLSDALDSRTKSYVASGTVRVQSQSISSESFVAQTPENTVLYTISGQAKKSVLLTTDFTGVVQVSGTSGDPIIRKSFGGSGKLSTRSGAAWNFTRKSISNVVLVSISGISRTKIVQVFGYYGDQKNPGTSGTITISGQLSHPQIDYTPAYKTSGLFRVGGTAKTNPSLLVIGIGRISISGASKQKFSYQGSERTILTTISGSANTRELNVYQDFITSGLYRISGISATREIQLYGYYGDQKNPGTSGVIRISGTPLVHPNVRYIPSPDGSGTIFISGVGRRRRIFPLYTGAGILFAFSSGKESYSRSTYVGIGNVILSSSGITEILQFEEGRTYVVII